MEFWSSGGVLRVCGLNVWRWASGRRIVGVANVRHRAIKFRTSGSSARYRRVDVKVSRSRAPEGCRRVARRYGALKLWSAATWRYGGINLERAGGALLACRGRSVEGGTLGL